VQVDCSSYIDHDAAVGSATGEGTLATLDIRASRTTILGRDAQLSVVDRFLVGDRLLQSLVVSGSPGIGKTTLWEAAVERARAEGLRILIARGAETEAKLSLAGVTDLLEPVADFVFPRLPAPQRQALDVALLRAEPGPRPPGSRTVATAVLSALRALAKEGPVLVALDDVQWLDPASQEAIGFAARRVDAGVRFLVAIRTDTESVIVEALDARHATRIEVGGLSLGATRRLIAERLDVTLQRRLLVELHELTDGNPLFALEAARALAERAEARLDEPIPAPDDLSVLMRKRVAALPESTRELLLVAALMSRADAETLRAALRRPVERDLESAERADIASLRGGAVVFGHPLYAAAVVGNATTGERRRAHRLLSTMVPALEERARHLALGVEGRDEAAASTIHEAARNSLARGALAAASELAELAVEIGDTRSPEHPRRLLDLAAFLRCGGESGRAYAVLDGIETWDGWPPALEARARGQLLLATYWTHGATAAVARGERMLAADHLGAESRATVHAYLSGCCEFDLERAAEHGETALRLLDGLDGEPDPGTLAHALALQVRNGVLLGRGLDRAAVEGVAALEAQLPPERFAGEAMSDYLAVLFKHVDDLQGSRERLQALVADGTDAENDVTQTVARMHLALTECWAGDLDAAREQLDAIAERIDERGTRNVFLLAARALVEAHAGDAEAVRALASELRAEHGDPGAEVYGIYLEAATGLLELSLGESEAADETFQRLLEVLDTGGHREPGIFRAHGNAGEAAVAVGALERAEAIAATLAGHAERTNHRWSRATAERVLALVAAERGELDAAAAHAERALEEYALLPMPLERARALLVAGVVERRARRRARARALLEEAVAEFDRLGARLWCERARAELGRISGRRRTAERELTPAERRTVELAAVGLSNKEIARQSFVTVHTIELHLSHAYAKLGVRSRGQLAARLAAAKD
jgi:DNA-binding CsgD family transcriptional regulator